MFKTFLSLFCLNTSKRVSERANERERKFIEISWCKWNTFECMRIILHKQWQRHRKELMVKVFEVTLECQPSSMWWHSFGVTYKSRHIFLDSQAFLFFLFFYYKAYFPSCFQQPANSSRENFLPFFIVRQRQRRRRWTLNMEKSNDIWNLNWIFFTPSSLFHLFAREWVHFVYICAKHILFLCHKAGRVSRKMLVTQFTKK